MKIRNSLVVLIISVLLISCGNDNSKSKKVVDLNSLLETIKVDLSKISTKKVVPDSGKIVYSSYNNNFGQFIADLDSLLEKYPNSMILKNTHLKFISRLGKDSLLNFLKNNETKAKVDPFYRSMYALISEEIDGKKFLLDEISKNPNEAFYYFGLAKLVNKENPESFDIQEKLLFMTIKNNPVLEEAYQWLSYIYVVSGKQELAVDLNKILLQIDPSNKYAFEVILGHHIEKENKDIAKKLVEDFISNNPNLENLYRASIYLELKDYKTMYSILKKDITTEEQHNGEYFYMSARYYVHHDNIDKALENIKKMTEVSSGPVLEMRILDPNFEKKLKNNKEYRKICKDKFGFISGDKFPILKGDLLSGKAYDAKNYSGKVLLLDFWASWCGPCKAELPNVIKIYQLNHEKGLEIVGVNLDKTKEEANDFIKSSGIKWENFFSGKGFQDSIVKMFKVNGIPSTYLVDKKGIIRYKNLRGKDLEVKVAELIAE